MTVYRARHYLNESQIVGTTRAVDTLDHNEKFTERQLHAVHGRFEPDYTTPAKMSSETRGLIDQAMSSAWVEVAADLVLAILDRDKVPPSLTLVA